MKNISLDPAITYDNAVADLVLQNGFVEEHKEYWWLLPERDAVLALSLTPMNYPALTVAIHPRCEAVRALRLMTREIEGWEISTITPEMRAAFTEWHESFPPQPGNDDSDVKTLELGKRCCFFVQPTEKTSDGWVVCIAVEDYQGFYRTSWRWDCSFQQAQDRCKEKNSALGIADEEAKTIQSYSMQSEVNSHAW